MSGPENKTFDDLEGLTEKLNDNTVPGETPEPASIKGHGPTITPPDDDDEGVIIGGLPGATMNVDGDNNTDVIGDLPGAHPEPLPLDMKHATSTAANPDQALEAHVTIEDDEDEEVKGPDLFEEPTVILPEDTESVELVNNYGRRIAIVLAATGGAALLAGGATLAVYQQMNKDEAAPVEALEPVKNIEALVDPNETPKVEAFSFPEAFADQEAALNELQEKTGKSYFTYICADKGGILNVDGPDGGFKWKDGSEERTWVDGQAWKQAAGHQPLARNPLEVCQDKKNFGKAIFEPMELLDEAGQ